MKRALSLLLAFCASVTLALDVRVPGLSSGDVGAIVTTSTVARALVADYASTGPFVPMDEFGDAAASTLQLGSGITLSATGGSDQDISFLWDDVANAGIQLVGLDGGGVRSEITLGAPEIGAHLYPQFTLDGSTFWMVTTEGYETGKVWRIRVENTAPISGYPAPLAVSTATATNVIQWGYATNHFEIAHTNGTLFLTNLWADATHAQYSMVYLHNSNAQPFSVQGLDYWNSNGCEIAAMPPLNKYNKLMFERDARGVKTGYVISTNTVSK